MQRPRDRRGQQHGDSGFLDFSAEGRAYRVGLCYLEEEWGNAVVFAIAVQKVQVDEVGSRGRRYGVLPTAGCHRGVRDCAMSAVCMRRDGRGGIFSAELVSSWLSFLPVMAAIIVYFP